MRFDLVRHVQHPNRGRDPRDDAVTRRDKTVRGAIVGGEAHPVITHPVIVAD